MTIFLTGGSGGIGSIISKALKQADINVIEPTSKELDLSSDFKVNYKVNGFIHCAGVNHIKRHSDITLEEFTNFFIILLAISIIYSFSILIVLMLNHKY
jgi:short-subunit dehydrogenase